MTEHDGADQTSPQTLRVDPRSASLRQGRELALRVLYAEDLNTVTAYEAWMRCRASFLDAELPGLADPDDAHMGRVVQITLHWLKQVRARLMEIDGVIRGSSQKWRVSRMPVTDRNILRIGVFELLDGRVPPRDVIYDCVELAKRYGEAPSPKFINGILDQICRDNRISLQ